MNLCELEVRLVYGMSSRTAEATQRKSVLKQKRKQISRAKVNGVLSVTPGPPRNTVMKRKDCVLNTTPQKCEPKSPTGGFLGS